MKKTIIINRDGLYDLATLDNEIGVLALKVIGDTTYLDDEFSLTIETQ